ncbi:DUF2946 domain-containing protein [Rhodanobacter aciditrophus]|uniref:DUF2946 domain-containing protein n=1 Tax=Rhodanobacter aciditrophus TaxID=1623218 RepID=UPI003CEA7F25
MRVFARHAMHRRLAWLALLAMAFVTALPSISRVLPMATAMPGMDAADHGLRDAAHQPHAPGHPDDPLQRCAYCVLLAHSPALGAAAVAPLLSPIPMPSAPPVARIVAVRVQPSWSAPARGPPLPA